MSINPWIIHEAPVSPGCTLDVNIITYFYGADRGDTMLFYFVKLLLFYKFFIFLFFFDILFFIGDSKGISEIFSL